MYQQSSRRVQVFTNSFKIHGLPQKPYYQYDAFEDEKLANQKDARRRIEIFERLQNHTHPDIFKPKVIYDGDAIAYSSSVLSFGNASTFEVNMSDRPGPNQKRGIFRVALKRVDAAPITFGDLQGFIEGHTRQFSPSAAVALNLIQLVVRQGPNLKYPNNVKAFFCREAGNRSIGGGLEVLKGFYQSVRPTFRSLLVNIDTSCGVLYKAGPMIEVALSVLGETTHPRDLYLDEGPNLAKLRKFFKGIFITFKHRQGKKKVESIVPRGGLERFEWNKDKYEGTVQSTTVQAYFREAYNITVMHPEAVGVRIGGGSVVPIELCFVAPNQRFTHRLQPEMAKKMVEFTSDKPRARLDTICRGTVGQALDYASSPFVKDAGLQIEQRPTVIDGKILATPEIKYAGERVVTPRSGSWNAMNQRFQDAKPIENWIVVDYSPRLSKDRPVNETFVEKLRGNCQKLGMNMGAPKLYFGGNGSNVINDLIQVVGRAPVPIDMVLVILPSSAAEIRFNVKRFGDVIQGVVTQCVRVDKVARANDQYCNNVAMKINAKMGGMNAFPHSTVLRELQKFPFIIMGADVGHPAPGVHDQPSVASLVSSCDQHVAKYRVYTSIQAPRLETIDQLESMVYDALLDFGVCGRIIFFRDGLSEGEYTKVAEKEIKDIQAAVDRIWADKKASKPKPWITFIVVGKRHHVRFFPRDDKDADKSGNCQAGFVADNGIGNPMAKDYYLQSHGGLLGTSRPSHYIIIRDDNFRNNVEKLQELSFLLCHSYARATRSVSIPAPVYYADLMCSRANFHFAPELRYDDSNVSVTSGKSTFNLDRWKAGYQKAHNSMKNKMFFM